MSAKSGSAAEHGRRDAGDQGATFRTWSQAATLGAAVAWLKSVQAWVEGPQAPEWWHALSLARRAVEEGLRRCEAENGGDPAEAPSLTEFRRAPNR